MAAESKIDLDSLLQRVRSALILLPFVITPVVLGGWAFAVLLAVAGVLMAREWGGLLQVDRQNGYWLGGLIVVLMAVGGAAGAGQGMALLAVMLPAVAAIALWRGARMTPVVGGLVYLGLPLLAAQWFREDALGMLVIGYVLLTVWAVDIFAMFSGKLIGGPKLAPVISPNKTWAGLGGAVVGAMIAGLLSFLVIVGFGYGTADFAALMVLAVILACVAQAADLFESHIKRKYDMKDSGAIIPGHGGLLDRVDGLLGVLLFLLALAVIRGGAVSGALWVW